MHQAAKTAYPGHPTCHSVHQAANVSIAKFRPQSKQINKTSGTAQVLLFCYYFSTEDSKRLHVNSLEEKEQEI